MSKCTIFYKEIRSGAIKRLNRGCKFFLNDVGLFRRVTSEFCLFSGFMNLCERLNINNINVTEVKIFFLFWSLISIGSLVELGLCFNINKNIRHDLKKI